MLKQEVRGNFFQEEAYIAKKEKKKRSVMINLPIKNIQDDTGHHILPSWLQFFPTQLKCILTFLLISNPPGRQRQKNYWIQGMGRRCNHSDILVPFDMTFDIFIPKQPQSISADSNHI